jgi:hypothetical protein
MVNYTLLKTLDSAYVFWHIARMDDFLRGIRDRKRELKQQLEQLNAAERAYRAAAKGVRSKPTTSAVLPGLDKATPPKRNTTILPGMKTPTIKQSVMQLLENYPKGLTALQILEKLQQTVRPELQRHVLSPQLSRLRQEDRLSHIGNIWSLSQPTFLKQGGDDNAID